MQQLISFDIKADFGFLKKPDTNEPVYITYNMLHKPALLGILGAIIGLKGFKVLLETSRKKKREYVPEYYEKLKDLKVGIQPLESENGNFSKTIIRYNNGVGYASKEQGGNLIIDEQTLIKPSYRCFLLLNLGKDLQKQLYANLKNSEAEYLPYLGKNDFSVWWENFGEYPITPFAIKGKYKIASLIEKENALAEGIAKSFGIMATLQQGNQFTYFEHLPVGYNLDLMQYELKDFAFTNATLNQDYHIKGLYQINENEVIQLF